MSREVQLNRNGDAHFTVRANVYVIGENVSLTRTVVVCASSGDSEVCDQTMRMTRAEWLAVLPLLNDALGVQAEVRA